MLLLDQFIPTNECPFSSGVLNSTGGRVPSRNWVRLRQPYLDSRGRACVELSGMDNDFTRNDSRGGEKRPLVKPYLVNDLRMAGYPLPMVTNAVTLTAEAWRETQRTVMRSFRQRLRAAADLERDNPYGGFDAMGRMTLEYYAMNDPGEAVVDMDARTDGRDDAPLALLRSVPLPIVHSDFGYSSRQLAVSRNGRMPYDVVLPEAGGRRVAEMVEDLTLGTVTGPTYGTQTAGYGAHTGASVVQGYLNFTNRLTKTNITAPTTGGWVPDTAHNEILAALSQLYDQYAFGPFRIYHSTDWTPYMNRVYSVSGGNTPGETLRTMLLKNPDIRSVERVDRLTNTFTLIIVSTSNETAQMVNGMEVTTVQWEEKGGLDLRLKIMTIKVPILRSDYSSRTGVLIATTA